MGRKSSQPLRFRSAGSVFKNPPNNAAGYLIDQVGLKGLKLAELKFQIIMQIFLSIMVMLPQGILLILLEWQERKCTKNLM